MDLVHGVTSASTVDASFDTLARTVGQRLPRRQALRLLAVTLATGTLGAAALSEAAAKGKSHSQNHSSHSKSKSSHSKDSLSAKRRKGGGGKGGGTVIIQPPTTTTPAPIQQPTTTTPAPVQLPDASQNCRAAGNQCGSVAGVQGTCRVAAAPDNQAGFLCTSNTAGNTCVASTQCGAGTRCVIQGALQNCRVVIG
jgi:hypothetical protein